MDEQLTFEFAERPTIKGFPELRWTGKRPYRSTQYYPAQLRERYGEEKDGWINKIFWGDNLQVMSHMLKEYRGKIDLIYIDPPFDSKADYKKKIEIKGVGKAETDSTSFEEKQYGDIWTNDEYLQFMYERIILLRELMSSSGNIFVHCDWHKSSYLRIICDAHMFQMFDDWRNHRDKFSDVSYYTIHKRGQITLLDLGDEQNEAIFKQMKKYRESYPNYIYALTMGLGKTILMGTCIFYEFLLANKYPKDKRFCHNALVFAPDKTVLESLREIMTFDKTKVVPPEYARVLDANIKFHYLDESGTTLQTIDDSDFNIIISNNQKIIVKKKRKEDKPTDVLFGSGSLLADVYGDDDDSDVWDDATLMDNQRFKKLCRLPQLGVYVDEAHHLFGANLEKELRLGGANKTTLRNTINMLAEATSIVACYNYTGTPYVKRQVLPEVVYAYGLRDSISHGFLKDADPIGFDNVKNEEFLKKSITMFWERYGGKTYEGLPPKMAIFAASVAEATDVVRPAVEKILSELNVSLDTILVNTGDTTVTKNDDIRDFNNLDVLGTEGSRKQFIILVEKGREGWNCRSLLGIALFRSPKSKIFVLQATMRCLRKLTDEQLKATVFLSKENLDTLDEELRNNYNMEIKDLGQSSDKKKNSYKVRVLPPPRSIKMKRIWHEYSLIEKEYSEPIDFKVSEIDDAKYESRMYEKGSIRLELSTKETVIDDIKDQMRYSRFS